MSLLLSPCSTFWLLELLVLCKSVLITISGGIQSGSFNPLVSVTDGFPIARLFQKLSDYCLMLQQLPTEFCKMLFFCVVLLQGYTKVLTCPFLLDLVFFSYSCWSHKNFDEKVTLSFWSFNAVFRESTCWFDGHTERRTFPAKPKNSALGSTKLLSVRASTVHNSRRRCSSFFSLGIFADCIWLVQFFSECTIACFWIVLLRIFFCLIDSFDFGQNEKMAAESRNKTKND